MEKKDILAEVCNYIRYKAGVKTDKELAAFLKVSPASLSSALNGNTRYLNDKFLLKLRSMFPELSADYLLRGEGEMLRESGSAMPRNAKREIDEDVLELMKSQQKTIDSQQEMLREQQRSISRLVDRVTAESDLKKGSAEVS